MPDIQLTDDHTNAVQIGGGDVRGRFIRMGAALDATLGANRYPKPVSALLGEAIMISALVGMSLKFEGRLLVQAHGTNDGAVSLLVAECTTQGAVRAYARFDSASLDRLMTNNKTPDAQTLMGGGSFALTIDPGAGKKRYQSIAPIDGETLGACAEHYFEQSEQIPTRMKLAVGQSQIPGEAPQWRGGGLMVQRVAGDTRRGETTESWNMSQAVMATLTASELLDPNLEAKTLLYRLFHEQGVRMGAPVSISAHCSCSKERLQATINRFDATTRDQMFVDGIIKTSCEFCMAEYDFTQDDFTPR